MRMTNAEREIRHAEAEILRKWMLGDLRGKTFIPFDRAAELSPGSDAQIVWDAIAWMWEGTWSEEEFFSQVFEWSALRRCYAFFCSDEPIAEPVVVRHKWLRFLDEEVISTWWPFADQKAWLANQYQLERASIPTHPNDAVTLKPKHLSRLRKSVRQWQRGVSIRDLRNNK